MGINRYWQELKPGEGFMGVRWGSSIEAVTKVFPTMHPKEVSIYSRIHPKETKYTTITTLGAVQVVLDLNFIDNKFIGVWGIFPTHQFDYVKNIFIERYGKTTLSSGETKEARWTNIRDTAFISVAINPFKPESLAGFFVFGSVLSIQYQRELEKNAAKGL